MTLFQVFLLLNLDLGILWLNLGVLLVDFCVIY